MKAIPTINVKDLKPHPQNAEIYGEEDIKELAEKIKESNWVKPLVITPDGTVISGHRRLKACLMLGIKEVEYEAVHFNNKNEELERLLLENESREKTTYQKMQEGKFWEEVIKEKARLRKLSTLNNQSIEVENFPPRGNEEVGKTRDIVAEKIGVGSGKTYEAAKKVVDEIDNLKVEGKEKDSEFLKTVLNDGGVNTAKNLLKTDLTKIDDELKDKVINNEITAKEAVKNIKKEAEVKNDDSAKEEMKVCNKCGQEKSIHNFYEAKNQCIECIKASRNPEDVYGNEIKIDKEKIKGIDIEALLVDVKNTNKDINMADSDSIAMEFSSNVNMFVQNIGKYLEMEEQFEDMKNENKDKIIDSITSVEEIINKIKGFLF